MEELTRIKYFPVKHHLLAIVLLNIFLLPASYNVAFAAPTPVTQASSCPSTCTSSLASVLKYEDKEYLYDYESEVTTTVDSSKPETKKTNVKAEVVLSVQSSCNFVIRVKKLAISNDGGQPQLVAGLERSAGKFTLEDGVVGSLCIREGEPTWTANIKRAVVSLLQNKALSQNGLSDDEEIESDISGKCPTKYEVNNNVYTKSKNLNECSRRDGGLSVFQGVPYEVKSKHNSASDLDSSQTCEQVLENGIYKAITCIEVHTLDTKDAQFLPSLQTSVKASLTHKATRPGQTKVSPPTDLVQSSIFFDNVDTVTDAKVQDAAKTEVSDTLDRICSNIRPDGVTSEVPQEILTLKNSLKQIRGSDLTEIYNQIGTSLCNTQGAKLKKLLLDTAALSASDGAIQLLSDLYAKNALDLVAKRYFYLYTSFATKPSDATLRAVLPLISTDAPAKRLVLTVSGLAHRYCKVTNPNCINNADYQNVVNKIASLAQKNCLLSTEKELNLAIASLEALGNIDSLTPKAVGAIQKCLAEGTDRVKSVAIKAFRRDPCNSALKADAISVFGDLKIPSNVRINAFSAALRCLNPEEIPAIQKIISEEKSVQVGGFVRSFLQNAVRSSSPSTRHLQTAARKLSSGVKYPQEIRKFSRNFASSFFNPSLNLGYSASGDVLFSKDSFLPRELAANLTLDLCGTSYNLIDVGVHLENFDSLQESLFGPEGSLTSDNNLNHIMTNVFKLPGNSVSAWRTASVAEPAEQPTGDVYIRIFGTTVALVSLTADSVNQRAADAKNKVKNLVRQAFQTSTRDIDIIAPILFLDDQISVPTISGFGLSNAIEGTIIPSLEYKKDYTAPSASSSAMDLNLKLVTNAATTIKAKHSLIGGPYESGIQLEGNLRTGGSIEFILHADDDKFEARLNMPNEKVRALELSTNVNWVRRSPGTPQILSPYRQSLQVVSGPENCDDIFLNELIKFTGLKICTSTNINAGNGAEASIPLLLRGKQYFFFNVQKTEPSMEGYAIVFTNSVGGNKREFQLTLDTPGSTTDRKVSLSASRRSESEKKFVVVQLATPYKGANVKFEYDATNSDTVKAINAKLTLPSAAYSITGKVNMASTAPGETTYKPLLQFEYPGKKSGTTQKRTFLTGKVVHTPGSSLSFDLSHEFPEKLINISPMNIFLKGSVARSYADSDYSYQFNNIELGVRNRDMAEDTPPSPVLKIDGTCKSQEGRTKLSTDLAISFGLELEHKFTFHKDALRQPGKVTANFKTTSSSLQILNIELQADHSKQDGKYDSKYKLVVGPESKPRWSLSTETHVAVDSVTHFDFQNELKLRFDIAETYDVTFKTNVKIAAGEEQLVDIQFLNGDNGNDGKVILNFNRKAAENNDFKLNILYTCPRMKQDGELTHTRTTVTDKSEDWTLAVKHETTFSSQSLKISKDHLITNIRYRNTPTNKALSVKSKLNLHNDFDLGLDFGVEKSAKKYAGKVLLKLRGEDAGLVDILVLPNPGPSDNQVTIKSFLTKTYKVDLTRKIPSETEAKTQFRAEFTPTGRVITLDVQRKKNGDAYEVDGDLKWNAESDPNQSLQLYSVTKVTRGSVIIESKNDITVIGQKVTLNVNAKIPTNPFHGEHSLGVTYVSTAGKTYQVDYKNDLEITSSKRTTDAEVSATLPDVSPVQIRLKAQSLNPVLSELLFDLTSEVQILTNGEKTHDLVTELRSTKDATKLTRTLQGKLATGGSSLTDPILLDGQLTVGQNTFSTKNSAQVGSNVIGVEIEALSENGVPSLTYTFTNIPGLKYKKIEGTKTYTINWSKNDRVYKFGSTHAIKADSQSLVTYSYDFAYESGQVEGKAGVVYIGKPVFNANIKGRAKPEDVALEGYLTFGEQAKPLTWDLKYKNDDGGKTFVLGSSLEESAFKLKLDLPEKAVYNLALNTKRGSSEYQVDFEVVLKEKKKSLSLISTRNRSEVLVEIKLNGSEEGDSYKFGSLLTRGSTTVSAEGQLQKVAGGYDGSVNYQLPGNAAGVAKFTVVIEANRRKISLVAGDQAKPLEFVNLEYTRESADARSTKFQGTFSTDVVKYFDDASDKVSGNFNAEYKRFSSKDGDSENGRSFTSHSTFTSPAFQAGTIDLEIKHTDKELRAYTSVTYGSNNAVGAEIQAKAQMSDAACDGAVKLLLQRTSDGSKSSYGVASSTVATKTPYNLDHSTEIFFEQASIKIQAYGNSKSADQCEGGLDVTLPARTISVTYSKNSPTSGELNVWLDKVRKPDQKLHADVTFEKLRTDDGASGYKYTISLQHPTLAKPLVIKRRVVRFGDSILLDSETELDIFSDPSKKIVVTSKFQWADSDHLDGKLSVQSEGLGLSVDGKTSLEIKDDSFDVTVGYNYKNRNGETVSRRGALIVSGRHQSLTIGKPSSPDFYISRSLREGAGRRKRRADLSLLYKPRDVIDVRYEFHLPGMVDNRVVDIYAQGSVPPQVNIKTYTTSAKPRRAYELSLGFPTEQLFLVGLYKQAESTRATLSEFSVALNGTNFLSIKASWNAQNIQESLKQSIERLSGTVGNAAASSESLVSELSQDVESVVQKLSQASQDLKPLRDHIKNELKEIKQELVQDENFKVIAQSLESFCQSVELALDPLEALINDFPEIIERLIESSPVLVKRYEKLVLSLKRTTANFIRVLYRTVRPILAEIKVVFDGISGKLQNDFNAGAQEALKKAQTFSDTFLAQLAEALLRRLDDVNTFLENSPVSPQVKELIKTLLKYTVVKLKGDEQEAAATQEQIIQQAKETVRKLVREIFTVDLKNGYVAVLLPLPRPVHSLYDFQRAIASALTVPRVEIPNRNQLIASVQVLRQFLRELVQSDLLSAVIAALRTNAPPHSANAFIIGSQYFITFDGKEYHFEGDCKYQLIQNQELNVFLQFSKSSQGRVQKAISVEYNGRIAVTINPDFTFSSGDPNVRVSEDRLTDIMVVDVGFKGRGWTELSISCNKASDVCTVRLENAYRFGKVSGLLGTYNNEQYDDFQTPTGTIAQNVDEFASSWRVDSSCSETSAPEHSPVASQAKNACTSAFKGTWSSLRACFKYSNPSEFETICENLSTEQGWTLNQAVCTAAFAYEQTCPDGLVDSSSYCK